MSNPAAPHYITVVSGVPRSGTSLMMRMLEAGGVPPLSDGLRQPDDNNPHGYFELEAVKRTKADPTWVASARGKAVKVICPLLPDLPAALPASLGGGTLEYRVVLMVRDLDEVVASQTSMLKRLGKVPASLAPDALKKLFTQQLDLTRRWAQAPSRSLLEVPYNQLMASPAVAIAIIGRIQTFMAGHAPLGAAEMVGTIDPGLYRERRG
ncbi:MAG: sulfotransferase family protein [Planctomycetota bacterium]|nr:sulfotransferase family protein [Planctomycetota bacterium]